MLSDGRKSDGCGLAPENSLKKVSSWIDYSRVVWYITFLCKVSCNLWGSRSYVGKEYADRKCSQADLGGLYSWADQKELSGILHRDRILGHPGNDLAIAGTHGLFGKWRKNPHDYWRRTYHSRIPVGSRTSDCNSTFPRRLHQASRSRPEG